MEYKKKGNSKRNVLKQNPKKAEWKELGTKCLHTTYTRN